MKKYNFFLASVLILAPVVLFAQTNIATSLHYTRQGKITAYSAENGGMETITGIAMDTLACMKCHPANYADGTPVDPATYSPGCNDCHNFAQGNTVEESTCLGCHSRQKYERQMMGTDTLDVHMKRGMVCKDCHSKEEIHGDDGVQYASLLEPGAIKIKCTSCHTTLASNSYHDTHKEKVDCDACHTESMIACASCHFESLLATGKNRANTKLKGFELLVKRDGMVTTGTFMTHTYDGKTNYIIASNHAHFIVKNAKTCADCHYNMGNAVPAIEEYNTTGKITMTTWDEASKKNKGPQGVIPIPADFREALQFDYAGYGGDPAVFPSDPNAWSYLKSESDNGHLFYAEPLDTAIMKKLGFTRIPTSVQQNGERFTPSDFSLKQNYPNPFNPTTTIEFSLAKTEKVSLIVYDLTGRVIALLMKDQNVNPGTHQVFFEASHVPSGVYIYVLSTPDFKETRKMILMK